MYKVELMVWGKMLQYAGRIMSEESDSFPKQIRPSRLIDIMSEP